MRLFGALLTFAVGLTLLGGDAAPQTACTFYAAPRGGGNGRSQGSPFQIANFWAVARPGSTLCLLDGTYTGAQSMLQVPASVQGTAGQPITVRALNDGQVLLDGGNGVRPVNLESTYGIFEGFNMRGGDNKTLAIRGHHNLVRRVVVLGGGDNGRNYGDTLIDMAGHHNVLEDCAGFGKARKTVGITAAAIPSSHNTIRRCWVRWESNPVTTSNPTNTLELGYGQDHGTYENMLVTHKTSGRVTDPEGMASIFRTQGSAIQSSIFYVGPQDPFAPSVIVGGADDAGSPPQKGDFHTMADFMARQIVAFIHPSHQKFGSVRGLHFFRNYRPPTNSRVEEAVSVAGVAPTITGGFQSRQVHHGTSLSAALSGSGHSNIWTLLPGLCFRTVNRTVTQEPLWPWPMQARIKAAAGIDITATMEEYFGAIPPQCRGKAAAASNPTPRTLRLLPPE